MQSARGRTRRLEKNREVNSVALLTKSLVRVGPRETC